MKLNEELMKKQNLSQDDIDLLYELHEQLDHVVNNPDEYKNPVSVIERFEFLLQKTWGFEQDSNYHTHWLRIKGCTCPKMDNRDTVYFGRRVINNSCPHHGRQHL